LFVLFVASPEVQEFWSLDNQTLLDLRSLDSLQDDTVVRGYLKNQKVLELVQEVLEIHVSTAEVLVHGFKIFYSLFTLAKLEVSGCGKWEGRGLHTDDTFV